MKYPSYPKMKDSGIDWLGEIPEHWDVIKFKWLFEIIYRYPTYYGIDYQNSGVIEVRGEMLVNGKIDLNNEPRFISVKTSKKFPKTELKPGDIVMSVRGTMGKIGLVDEELKGANITANLLRLSPNEEIVFSKWLATLLNSKLFNEVLNNFSTQTTIKTITVPELSSIFMPLPSKTEQKSIANFLDQETERIDKLIKKKEKLIELLVEKRQAIISRAVTKGLDPDVPMKDSGIEWLGKIPENWDVIKLKYKNEINMGQSPPSDSYNKKGIGLPFLQGNADFGEFYPETEVYCDDVIKTASKNDIMVSVRAPVGEINFADQQYGIGRGLCAIKPDKINRTYLWFLLKVIRKEWFLKSTGSTYDSISTEIIKSTNCLFPPLKEQKEIANYLEQETERIGKMETKIQKQIANLKEYRQALITNAVTGKIDVRDMV